MSAAFSPIMIDGAIGIARRQRRRDRGIGDPRARDAMDSKLGPAALLLLAAALSPPTAAAQRTPQPVFTELFTYDPTAPPRCWE
jgi:hypothetical protein